MLNSPLTCIKVSINYNRHLSKDRNQNSSVSSSRGHKHSPSKKKKQIHNEFHSQLTLEDAILRREHKVVTISFSEEPPSLRLLCLPLLCAMVVPSCHPPSNPMRQRRLSAPFCRWGNWGSGSLHDKPAHTALRVKWSSSFPCFCTAVHLRYTENCLLQSQQLQRECVQGWCVLSRTSVTIYINV